MKLPSLDRVRDAALAAANRFPEAVACAFVAGSAAALAIDTDVADQWWAIWRVASLGVPLFVALTLLSERWRWAARARWSAAGLGAALLVLLYVCFEGWETDSLPQRYGHLTVTLHLVVAVLPYLRVGEANGFWQFNRSLFYRFVLATVYALALYAGLALALAAVDNLLGVDVSDPQYVRLFFLIAYFFQPLFFLAGVPADFARLDRSHFYPAGLKVFGQFVMLPLVAVYVTILTIYMGKILVTETWPSGWISYLVTSLAGVGIFSLLLIHPERMKRERGWIDGYALAFWIAILPSAAMVVLALWQRVEQYGITERRYLLGVLAVWLAGMALYYAIRRTRDIKVIPLSLAIIGVVTFVGPWSAYAVAERSQVARMERILVGHGALVDGRVTPGVVEIPQQDMEQVGEVVAYLVSHHGTRAVDAWYAEDGGDGALVAVADTSIESGAEGARAEREGRIERVIEALGVRAIPSGLPVRLASNDRSAPVPVAGFDLLIPAEEDGEARVGGEALEFALSEDSVEIVMWLGGVEEGRTSLSHLIELAGQPRRAFDTISSTLGDTEDVRVPPEALVLELPGSRLSVRLVLHTLTLARHGARLVPSDFSFGAVLVRPREPPP